MQQAVGNNQFEINDEKIVFPATGPVKWPHIYWPFLKPFRTLTGPNDSYEMAAHTMTDPPPCLTPGKRRCGLNAFSGFL